jgi:hypothetical protein
MAAIANCSNEILPPPLDRTTAGAGAAKPGEQTNVTCRFARIISALTARKKVQMAFAGIDRLE